MRLFVFTLLFISSMAFAQTKIVIGVEDVEYLPYYDASSGQYAGFARDLFDRFAKDRNYQISYQILPVNRLFQALVDGSIDLKFPDHKYWNGDIKKGKDVKYTEAIVHNLEGALVLPENKGKGIGAIKKIGTVMGFTPYPFLDLINSKKIELESNPKFPGLVQQGMNKRVDAVFANTYVVADQLKKMNKEGALVFDNELPKSDDHFFASTVAKPQLVLDFNDWFKANTSFVNEVKSKYNLK